MLRKIKHNLNSAYISPVSASKKARQFIAKSPAPLNDVEQQPRRDQDRRCNRDRRQSNQAVILDLRSPHARRKYGRRTQEMQYHSIGIDVYA